ncbi:MAG: ice-binding family protein [Terracidiphilus sp.]
MSSMMKNTHIAGIALLAIAGSAFAAGPGPAPVNLRSAGDFVILTKSGITDVPTSAVTGDVGTSPITGAADLLTCTEVTGLVFSVTAAGPEPCNMKNPTRLTAAVLDMETAYTDAAGRSHPDFTELKRGDIGGLTLAPGLYKWSTSVSIPTDVTLSGSSNAVWIFQISGNLKESNGVTIHLRGGAQAKNVFWQVAGLSMLGTTSNFEGILLCKTLIAVQTHATVNGRLFSHTAVTLEMNRVTQP